MTDVLIGPAIPSNTARSGVLYPIVLSLAMDTGSNVEKGTRKKTGAYLMMVSITSLTISSALWFTAMAANPIGAGLAARLTHILIEQVFKNGANTFVSCCRYVGQVIGDGVQIALLRIHACFGNP